MTMPLHDRIMYTARQISDYLLEVYMQIDTTPDDQCVDHALAEAYQCLHKAELALMDARIRLAAYHKRTMPTELQLDTLDTNQPETRTSR